MEEKKIITITEAMELTGLSRKKITALLNVKGCPLLPRQKGQTYQIPRERFMEWVETRTR